MKEASYFFKFTDSKNESGNVWYTIQVFDSQEEGEPIIFKSRYSQMRIIHEKCQETKFGSQLPQFPQKKFFGNTKPEFIEKRKKQLQHYYNTLVKSVDLKKLPELYKFIMKHRKAKKEEAPTKPVPSSGIDDSINKEKSLKKAFDTIVKKTIEGMIDISDDFNHEVSEDSSKRYKNQLESIKIPVSELVCGAKAEGEEQNDGDFWSMFFHEEHGDILEKSKVVAERVLKINMKNESEMSGLVEVL